MPVMQEFERYSPIYISRWVVEKISQIKDIEKKVDKTGYTVNVMVL